MSNFVVPNTFTAGTKAKAEEVNENFTAIKDDLDTKSGQIQTLQTNVNTLQTNLGTKVLKSGDTMTGDLVFHKSSESFIKIQNDSFNYAITSAPSTTLIVGGIQFKDVNENIVGEFLNTFDTENVISSKIKTTRSINGEEKFAILKVSVDENGNSLCNFPMCTTNATTTSTASTSKVATVVENYKNSASWYRVWSDGWIEQGGFLANPSSDGVQTITFLKSFVDTNYTFISTCHFTNTEVSTSSKSTGSYGTKTGTSIQIYRPRSNNAGSRWYACGY